MNNIFKDPLPRDALTGLNTDQFFSENNDNYQRFVSINMNSTFVIIDLSKFKVINDTLGHEVGDRYLKLFATALKNSFQGEKNTLLFRLHGDEFAILTSLSEMEIANKLELCQDFLEQKSQEDHFNYPRILKFNAGSVLATKEKLETKIKADNMMYHAKQNGLTYQPFDIKIYEKEFMPKLVFINQLCDLFTQKKFQHVIRNYHYLSGATSEFFQVYTRDEDNKSIYNDKRYQVLRERSQIVNLDMYNLENIFQNYDLKGKSIFLSIDYHSLPFNDYYLKMMNEAYKEHLFEELIFSINLENIEVHEQAKIITNLRDLSESGFKICLEHFSSEFISLWEKIPNLAFIKFDNNYWKKAMDPKNKKIHFTLIYLVKALIMSNTKPIFGYLENDLEYNFVTSLTKNADQDILAFGDYFSKEEILIKKRI